MQLTKEQTIEETKKDIKKTAYHEAGHAVICQHYGIEWTFNQFTNQKPSTFEDKCLIGNIMYERFDYNNGRHTDYHLAVMAWGGMMAEQILENDCDNEWILDEIITNCFDAFNYHDSSFPELSQTDYNGICNTPFKWKACKMSFKILSKQWEQVDKLAKHFMSLIDVEKIVE